MQWFRKAADKGFALSQSSLGWGYMKGLGQDVGQGMQDHRQAAYWFNLAAQQGEPHAQVSLGMFYEEGGSRSEKIRYRAANIVVRRCRAGDRLDRRLSSALKKSIPFPATREAKPVALST